MRPSFARELFVAAVIVVTAATASAQDYTIDPSTIEQAEFTADLPESVVSVFARRERRQNLHIDAPAAEPLFYENVETVVACVSLQPKDGSAARSGCSSSSGAGVGYEQDPLLGSSYIDFCASGICVLAIGEGTGVPTTVSGTDPDQFLGIDLIRTARYSGSIAIDTGGGSSGFQDQPGYHYAFHGFPGTFLPEDGAALIDLVTESLENLVETLEEIAP